LFVNIVEEDKILIKSLHESNGYAAYQSIKEFPSTDLFRYTRTVNRQPGSGRPRSVDTDADADADLVQKLALIQEDKPQGHCD